MYTTHAAARRKLRVFSPVILFHEYERRTDVSTHYTDTSDQHSKKLKDSKKRIEDMLNENSQFWRKVFESTREHEKYEAACRRQYHLHLSQSYLNPAVSSISPASPASPPSLYRPESTCEAAAVPRPTKRRRGNLPKTTTALLKSWLAKHKKHPYPTEEEKLALAKETKLNLQQISNWFINARRRHLPHLLEADFTNGNAITPGRQNQIDVYNYEENSTEDSSSDHGLRRVSGTKCTRIHKNKKSQHLRNKRKSSM
ncbi:7435_t:CDS:2 [Paraglomus brasilianum]|uniref:7435_t:CDS:1 n=1 Tax=Paraglomus brasilianum TaxID=144538 RepID=A0A9N9B099_9GLOM|nr:7435_t:CDS:2 [Paraglomus brasilianum]